MQPNELADVCKLFEKAEAESDPARKFSFLEEALDLTDDFAADNPHSPSLSVVTNLRHAYLHCLLAQLVMRRDVDMVAWFRYVKLFELRVSKEVTAILADDAELNESYRKFVALWGNEFLEAVEKGL